jgi:hypothetical protein
VDFKLLKKKVSHYSLFSIFFSLPNSSSKDPWALAHWHISRAAGHFFRRHAKVASMINEEAKANGQCFGCCCPGYVQQSPFQLLAINLIPQIAKGPRGSSKKGEGEGKVPSTSTAAAVQ